MLQPQTELTGSKGTGFLHYGYGFEIIVQNGVIQSIYKDGCNADVCNITAYYPKLNTSFTILGNQDCKVWRLHNTVQELLLKEGME